ncbi:MAG: ABC transporter permease [Gammaproteobacteria bacterium]
MPVRLALRTLFLQRGRWVLAVLLIGASLCVLDLFAGHLSSTRARIEQQAVIGERLGHLSVMRRMFDELERPEFTLEQAERARRIIEANRGVAVAILETGLQDDSVRQVVVYLHHPDEMPRLRAELGRALRDAGILVDVSTWQEQADAWRNEQGVSDLAFESMVGMVLTVVAATVASTLSIDALVRRRELATLRACGMGSGGVFLMLVAQALWTALLAVVLSLVSSALVAWIVNRIALPASGPGLGPLNQPALVELDAERTLMAIGVVLAVALMAALVPALKAARAPIAPALSG